MRTSQLRDAHFVSHAHPPQGQILGLDIVRFASALLILAFHFETIFWEPWTPGGKIMELDPELKEPAPLFAFGFIGVQIFFVISGFVIAYSAESASAFKFFRNRVVRLAPTLWICATLNLAIFLAFDIADREETFRRYLREITLVPSYPWLSTVVWTLRIEAVFYILVFVLLCFGRFAWIGVLAACLACTGFVFHLLVSADLCGTFQSSETCQALSTNRRRTNLLLLDHGCFFAVGIFLWMWLLKGTALFKCWWAMPAIVACLLQIGSESHIGEATEPALASAAVTAWLVAMLVIIISIRFNHVALAFAGNRLRRAVRLVGLSTYPLYLVHYVAGGMFAWVLVQGGAGIDVAIAGAAVCVIALSIIMAATIEPWVQSVLRRALNTVGAALNRARIAPLNMLFRRPSS